MTASILCFLAYTPRAYSLCIKSGLLKLFWNSSVAIRKTESCTLIPLIGKDRFPQIPLLLRMGGVFKEFLTAATEIGSPNLCADKCLEA